MKSHFLIFISLVVSVFSTVLLAQQAGDYVATNSGDYNTAGNWSVADGAGGYSGVATSAPTTGINVWIPEGVSMTNTVSTANAKDLHIAGTLVSGVSATSTKDLTVNGNLYIASTGLLQSTSSNGGNVGTLKVGGSLPSGPCTIQIDGQLGSNSLTEVAGCGFRIYCEAGGITTLTGSGKLNIARFQSGASNTRNQTILIDMDANFLNSAINGKTLSLENGNAGTATKTLIINEGRTVQFVNNSPNALLGSQDNESMLHTTGNITYDIRGTLNTGAAGGLKLTTSTQTASAAEVVTLKVGPQGKLIVGARVLTKVAQPTQAIVYDFAEGSEIEFAGATGTSFSSPVAGETQSYMTAFSTLTTNSSAGTSFPYAFSVAGSLNVNENLTGTTITLLPGARATVHSGKTLAGDELNLSSSADGTATLIADGSVNFTVSKVSQYLSTARNWYVSSPVGNAQAPTGFTYYNYSETANSWAAVSTGTEFSKGIGYIALPASAPGTLTFTTQSGGSLTTGNVEIPLSYAGTSKKGFNLIGNPYPAHLTWSKTFVDNNAALIEPTIWYRTNADGTSNATGTWSFLTLNASSGEASPWGTSAVIPPMQAFWVKAITAGTLTLNHELPLSHQTSNPLKVPAGVPDERIRVRLQIDNGATTDETLIYFDAEASDAYDRFDSPKFAEPASVTQIYTTVDNTPLVINGRKELLTTALGFIPGEASGFTIKAIQLTNLPDNIQLILKDNVTLAETDLTDGVSTYSFSDQSAGSDRFELIFKTTGMTTGYMPERANSLKLFWSKEDGLEVFDYSPSLAGAEVQLYNRLGQKVTSFRLDKGQTHVNLSLSPDVYILKTDGVVRKLIVK